MRESRSFVESLPAGLPDAAAVAAAEASGVVRSVQNRVYPLESSSVGPMDVLLADVTCSGCCATLPRE